MSGGEPRATLNSEQGCANILLEVLGFGLIFMSIVLAVSYHFGWIT